MRFYKSQRYSARFLGGDSCYLIKKGNEVIASVIVSTVEPMSEQCLLHALVVDVKYRHQGLANLLVKCCLQRHADLVCFCQPKLTQLYIMLGFTLLSKQDIDTKLCGHLLARFRRYQIKQPALEALISSG